jgi:hypothetical protein
LFANISNTKYRRFRRLTIMNLTELKDAIPFLALILSALAYRHEKAKGRTVIEAQALWHPRGLPTIPIVLRNLSDETLVVTAAEILRPRGSKIAVDSQELFGLTPAFKPPEQQRVKVTRVAFSLIRMKASSAVSALNEAVVPLYFEGPRNWDGGWIKVRVAVASLASEAKPRWTTVKRYLDKRPAVAQRVDEPLSHVAAA